jgi:signal peptidase I
MGKVNCTKCGTDNLSNAKYCSVCGYEIPKPKTETSTEYIPLIIRKPKKRKVFVAFLLSLFTPGLGQIYNGQIIKGIIVFTLLFLVPFIFGLTRGVTLFFGLAFLFIFEVLLRIYSIIDAMIYARRQKEYMPKNFTKWYYQVLIISVVLSNLWMFKMQSILGAQTYIVPSDSAEPTLQLGDYIMCDLRIYKTSKPDYGDIVMIKRDDGNYYPSRIVGLPNDTLEINDDIVSINGVKSKTTYIKDTTSYIYKVSEFEEELPNGHKHKIYKNKQILDSSKTTMKNIIVPEDSYYLLGDNRDNARDSRYTGCTKRNDITGKVVYSYWGKSTNRININFQDK